jgi:hypothetical protein
MRLIKVENPEIIASPLYGYNNMRTCLCTAPKKRHVKLIFSPQSCREEFTRIIRETFIANSFQRRERLRDLDTRRTRVFCISCTPIPGAEKYLNKKKDIAEDRDELYKACAKNRKKYADRLIVGHKLVNHYEKKHGWPLSRFYKVDLGNHPQAVAYIVVGSAKWQKTPHYLSMYALMLRIGTRGFAVKDWEQETVSKALANFHGKDSSFVKTSYKKWDVLLSEYDKLVGNNTMKNMFSEKRLAHGSNGYNEGLYKLCSGSSYDLSFSYAFQNACRKAGIHQRVNIKPENPRT